VRDTRARDLVSSDWLSLCAQIQVNTDQFVCAVKDTLKGLFGMGAKKKGTSAASVSVLRVRAVTDEAL